MPQYIVGLGASAGGLEALMALIPQLKPNGKVCYLIAQHMAHDGHSELMARLLNRGAELPVLLAISGEKILPDHIYLIPAGKDGTVHFDLIKLSKPLAQNISTPSVNILFESLASSYAHKAFGVVLSGTGSDGVQGIKAIKEKGGSTIALHLDYAIFKGMPSSAIESGMIDLILTISEMGVELNKIAPTTKAPLMVEKVDKLNAAKQLLCAITDRVKQVTGIDFNGYKEETLWRRLDTRMAALGIKSYEEYVRHIAHNAKEATCIQQLFLVSYSSFFRDSASFEFLMAFLRQKILAKNFSGTLVIWVAACASGEEVFTLAIMASEIKVEHGLDLKIKITGVDLNPAAIDQANKGRYTSKIIKDVKPELLARHFIKHDDDYVVSDAIKAICEFHIGDIFNYLPATQVDLISCRNLLIYLKGQEQDKLIRKFYSLLNVNDYLFIGQSEMLSPQSNILFHQIDATHNLFKKH